MRGVKKACLFVSFSSNIYLLFVVETDSKLNIKYFMYVYTCMYVCRPMYVSIYVCMYVCMNMYASAFCLFVGLSLLESVIVGAWSDQNGLT